MARGVPNRVKSNGKISLLILYIDLSTVLMVTWFPYVACIKDIPPKCSGLQVAFAINIFPDVISPVYQYQQMELIH